MKELSLEISKEIYEKYKFVKELSMNGLQILALRALSRGFTPLMIKYGLEQVILKNYIPSLYSGDYVIDERRFITDVEFRTLMKYGEDVADFVMWA